MQYDEAAAMQLGPAFTSLPLPLYITSIDREIIASDAIRKPLRVSRNLHRFQIRFPKILSKTTLSRAKILLSSFLVVANHGTS